MIVRFKSLLGALALVAHSGLWTTSACCAGPESIQPDPEIQSTLAAISKFSNRKDRLLFYQHMDALEPIAQKNPEHLIRQLIWYDVHTATNGEMTSIVVLVTVSGLKSRVVSTLAPLMGKTQNAKIEGWIESLLYGFYGSPNEDPNFREFESYIRGKIDGSLSFDKPFVGYLFRRAPGQTVQAFAISSFADKRRQPFLWARHVVDDLLWRRRFGFAPD